MEALVSTTLTNEEATPKLVGKKFLPRAGAYLFDIPLSFGLAYVSSYGAALILRNVLLLVSNTAGYKFSFEEVDTGCLLLFVNLILDILYFSLFEWLYGRTLGKIIFGMRVVSINGENITFKQAITRAASRLIDGFFFGLVALGSMKPPLFQRVGDQFAGTMVVSTNESGTTKAPVWWKFIAALAVYLLLEVITRMLIYLIDIHIY